MNLITPTLISLIISTLPSCVSPQPRQPTLADQWLHICQTEINPAIRNRACVNYERQREIDRQNAENALRMLQTTNPPPATPNQWQPSQIRQNEPPPATRCRSYRHHGTGQVITDCQPLP